MLDVAADDAMIAAILNAAADVKHLAPKLKKHGLEMRSAYVNAKLHDKDAKDVIKGLTALAKEGAEAVGLKTLVVNPTPIRWGGALASACRAPMIWARCWSGRVWRWPIWTRPTPTRPRNSTPSPQARACGRRASSSSFPGSGARSMSPAGSAETRTDDAERLRAPGARSRPCLRLFIDPTGRHAP